MSEIIAAPNALSEEPPGPVRRLHGNLGVASIVFMVVAAAAPLGVIGGVVPLGIAAGNGAGFPATFVVSTVILLFFAVGFTALTPYVEDAGAFFSYVRTSLGFPAGIGIAHPSASFSGSLGIGLLFALISYVGFEATAIFRDEAKTPERTIPRATYIALILIGVFYAVTSWALISGWGDQEAVTLATDSGATFLADTAQRYIGVVGTDIITVLYFTSLFACI